ncbi:multidrug ABC transporter substrate-binding protein, partial [Pseudomonas sp. MWU13-2860]
GSSNAVPVEVAWVAPVYALTLAGVVILAALASAIPTRKILRRPIRSVLSEG